MKWCLEAALKVNKGLTGMVRPTDAEEVSAKPRGKSFCIFLLNEGWENR